MISVQPNVNYIAGRPPFDVSNAESKDIEFYLERLQEYFTAYDIRNDTDSPAKRRAILLTSLGSGAYRVLKDLFLLDKYKDFWPACNAAEWLLLAHWLVSRRERPILFCKSETGAKHRGVCERVKKSHRKMWIHQRAFKWYSTRSFHLRATRGAD